MRRLCIVALSLLATSIAAQTPQHLRIRVLDGRNGRPIERELVQLWYDEMDGSPITVQTAQDGTAEVPPPLSSALRIFVKPVRSLDCRPKMQEGPPLAYNLKRIESEGLAVEDRCGTPIIRKAPGEIVLFVRDRRWYDGFNQ